MAYKASESSLHVETLNILCNTNATILNKEHKFLSHCFSTLCLVFPISYLLVLVVIHYLATYHKREVTEHRPYIIPKRTFAVLQFIISCICVIPIVWCFYVAFYEEALMNVTFAENITLFMFFTAWGLIITYFRRLQLSKYYHMPGFVVISITCGILLVANVIHMASYTMANPNIDLKFIITCTFNGLLALYLVVAVFAIVYGKQNFRKYQYLRNNEPNSKVLLRDYFEIPLVVEYAEMNYQSAYLVSSCWSKTFFSWVNKLLAFGRVSSLDSFEHLFMIPEGFLSKHLLNRFKEITRRQKPVFVPSNTHSVGSLDENEFTVLSTQHTVSILRVFWEHCGRQYMWLGVLRFFRDLLDFATPMLLSSLLGYISHSTEASWHGILYASGMIATTLLLSFYNPHYDFQIQLVTLKFRGLIITGVYDKLVNSNHANLARFTTGSLINFVNTDADRIINFVPSFHMLWSLPLRIAIAFVLLYQQIGVSFLAGVAFTVLLIPLNHCLAKCIAALSRRLMDAKDSRVMLMSEILKGLKTVRYLGLESVYLSKVGVIRRRELKQLAGQKYLDAFCVFFWASTTVIITSLTFGLYVLLGNELTARKVFTSLALFNMLVAPLNAFPWIINGLVDAMVSMKRLQAFLSCRTMPPTSFYATCPMLPTSKSVAHSSAMTDNMTSSMLVELLNTCAPTTVALEVANASFIVESGDDTANGFKLNNVTLTADPSEPRLVLIEGLNGVGKTALLMSILGEFHKTNGSVFVWPAFNSDETACVSYAAQSPWLQNTTIRDNIIFHRPFRRKAYDHVLFACALSRELADLKPLGDLTVVGVDGARLSGGQKARVALARAVYPAALSLCLQENEEGEEKELSAEAPWKCRLFLLDNIYAALDGVVAEHISRHVVQDLLLNNTSYGVSEDGQETPWPCVVMTVDQLTDANCELYPLRNGDYKLKMEPGGEVAMEEIRLSKTRRRGESKTFENDDILDADDDIDLVEVDGHMMSLASEAASTDEVKERGNIDLSVYFHYSGSVGHLVVVVVILCVALMQAAKNLSDYWMAEWTSNDSGNSTNSSRIIQSGLLDSNRIIMLSYYPPQEAVKNDNNPFDYYFKVYLIIVGATLVLTLLRAFSFAAAGLRGAKRMHRSLLHSVVGAAPLRWAESTSLGQVLNRFAADVATVDVQLPFELNIFLAQLFVLLGTMVLLCFLMPVTLLALLPLGYAYYRTQRLYRFSSREVKRLSSLALSPIFTHVGDTVSGRTTIAAFRQRDYFTRQLHAYVDVSQRATFTASALANWLSFKLQLISAAVVTAVCVVAVGQHAYLADRMATEPPMVRESMAATVGLALSLVLTLTGVLNGVLGAFVEAEKQMVSVERCAQYIDALPVVENFEEEASGADGQQQYRRELSQGFVDLVDRAGQVDAAVIRFNHATISYRSRQSRHVALDRLTLEISRGQNVAIVGRTGSGKSSLLAALTNQVDVDSGEVLLLGHDVRCVNSRVRADLVCVVPQDPHVFAGSLKENLDPTGRFKSVQDLQHFVSSFQTPFFEYSTTGSINLSSATDQRALSFQEMLEESGANLGLGQRQVISLFRAIVTSRAPILCLDESTSYLDAGSAGKILSRQFFEKIRERTNVRTIVCVCHRIPDLTVFDQIIALADGRVTFQGDSQSYARFSGRISACDSTASSASSVA